MAVKQSQSTAPLQKRAWFVGGAASLFALRSLWYFDSLRNWGWAAFLLLLIGFSLILGIMDRLLAMVGIEKFARSGIWVSATIGLLVSIFFPSDLNGFIKEVMLFLVLVVVFGFVYELDKRLTSHIETRQGKASR